VKVIPLLLLVGTFPGFVRNPFDQRQATPCHFSKDFCANQGNVLTNEKKRIKLQKRIVHTHLQTSKAFGVQKLLVLILGTVKITIADGPCPNLELSITPILARKNVMSLSFLYDKLIINLNKAYWKCVSIHFYKY
jgi:hypothetical protein